MAAGLPGIFALTEQVEAGLAEPQKTQFLAVKAECPSGCHIEQILDRVRLYRELIGNHATNTFCGIAGGSQAKELDHAICSGISTAIVTPPPARLVAHKTFAQWINAAPHAQRAQPIEIFTTNYDTLFEQMMEEVNAPFFDGFIGSVQPFFAPACVDAENSRHDADVYPPRRWTRLWKLHGSINWRAVTEGGRPNARIIRVSGPLDAQSSGQELMIFPARDKYADSRRLPFLTYQDRLRKFLTRGRCLLLVAGYSFSDEHLNEILFQGLRSNPNAAVSVLDYGDVGEDGARRMSDRLADYGREFRNLAIYGPDRASIGGIVSPWNPTVAHHLRDTFWHEPGASSPLFTLGDFTSLAGYLERFVGIGSAHTNASEQVNDRPASELSSTGNA